MSKYIGALLWMFGAVVSASASEKTTELGRAQGYAAVLHILNQQKSVDKLLMIKKPPAIVRKYVREMAQYSAKAAERIEVWRKHDPAIAGDANGFPPVEADARKGIESSLTKSLLLHGGEAFTVRLLSSQVQASDYLAHALEVLAKGEVSDARKAQLEKDQKFYEELNGRAYELLISGKASQAHQAKGDAKDEAKGNRDNI